MDGTADDWVKMKSDVVDCMSELANDVSDVKEDIQQVLSEIQAMRSEFVKLQDSIHQLQTRVLLDDERERNRMLRKHILFPFVASRTEANTTVSKPKGKKKIKPPVT